MTHDTTALAVVEDNGRLPDVVVTPDDFYEDDDENVVYIDDDQEEARFLMGVLNYDDAG